MLTNTAHETQIAIDSPQPFLATFRTLYWLGWKVLVNEQPIDNINITKPDGLIQAPLPSGKYIVTLRLTNTPIRHLANIISWGTLLLFVVTIFYLSDGYVLRKPHKSQQKKRYG
ncbi:MAG: hypothetical protein B6242_01525 [Anaerolineaceae bacterium 4572_78]|nr:MAG: hypothetical protein B6242_01525 [Anaerolineaceae bacterium 4572_78]